VYTATSPEQPITGDIRRESQLTPGEARAEYLDLNGQITVHLDSYVEQRAKATEDFKALLTPLLERMQSMLSERGKLRKLLNIAGAPQWGEWLDEFEERLQLGITRRTIQRWLKKYREAQMEQPPAPDVNVIAKQAVRYVESKPQSEKLDTAVHSRKELNPAIRAELIRALEARAKKYLALAAKLKKGFKPLKTHTGKAHQRLVREQRAKLPDPLLEDKITAAADFKNASVREISYDIAKNVILANEYLGTMPGGVTNCFGLYFGGHLGSVVVFGSTAGNKVAASICGPEHADKVAILVRGATEDWADPPRTSADGRKHTGSAASFLIARACDMMAAKGKPVIVAYSDPAGNEKGTIYQSCNFLYTGRTGGTEVFITPDGKRHNTRQIHGLTRDRRNGELNYTRTRAEQKQLLIEQGCTFEKEGGKHRYVFFAGDKRTRKPLRKALKWEVLPHPRRDAQAVAADETIHTLAARNDVQRDQPQTTEIGDTSEPTPHGFVYEFVKDEKPYAVRDVNNPHVGIMFKFKSNTEADKYITDREHEAAAAMKAALDGADAPQVCEEETSFNAKVV
jgi:hypothetical protein